jgi:hypothetical protein
MMDQTTIEETIVKNVKPFNKSVKEGKITTLNVTSGPPKPASKKSLNKEYCPYCNRETTLIWVHSHYQCQKCKNVVLGCCGDK